MNTATTRSRASGERSPTIFAENSESFNELKPSIVKSNELKPSSTLIVNIENSVVQASPYALAPTFTMALRGEWARGGVVEFFADEQLLDFIKLPPAPWAVMASLFLAAIHAQSTHWHDAFVSTERLTELLDEHDVTSLSTGQTVYRLINRIRSKLAASIARKLTGSPHLSGKEWAELVLENSERTGYRIGLPPSQLRLVIGDFKYEANTDQRNDLGDKEEVKRSR